MSGNPDVLFRKLLEDTEAHHSLRDSKSKANPRMILESQRWVVQERKKGINSDTEGMKSTTQRGLVLVFLQCSDRV